VVQVSGEPVLFVEYDPESSSSSGGGGSETMYGGRGRERLLTVRYDASGRQVPATP